MSECLFSVHLVFSGRFLLSDFYLHGDVLEHLALKRCYKETMQCEGTMAIRTVPASPSKRTSLSEGCWACPVCIRLAVGRFSSWWTLSSELVEGQVTK